jgi:hypothetical protein
VKVFRNKPEGLENVHGSAPPPSDSAVGKNIYLGCVATYRKEVKTMFDVYELMGFKFESTDDGLVYCLNINDMYYKYGKAVCDEVVKACHLYNSVLKK